MNVSLNWLRDYIDISASVPELCDKLTMLGLEIEAVHTPGQAVKEVYVGKILSIDPHPDAEKLVVCKTDVGKGAPLQIVCGAKNMKPGDKVPTAVVGGELPGGFSIAAKKMRGVESQGMMCSARELGLGEEHDGLLILDPESPVGADAKTVLGLDDTILEVEITPNRGDWASMIGIARELAAAYGTSYRVPALKVSESSTKASDLSSVTIEAPDLCARYVGRVLSGVTIGPSPAWLVKRLTAAGQRCINNVVDVTNYVMLETGQPLHAFDFDKLAGRRIVVRKAREGERIKTIDQELRSLTTDMLVIADSERPVAVAGVMGGFDTEVGEGTNRIFLESAWFAPTSVRKTSRALGLISESSQRFQRGADVEMTLYAANRAAQLMLEICGGEIASGILDVYPKAIHRNEITLRYSRANAVIGCPIPGNRQREIILGLGFEELKSNSGILTVRTPSWRHDCSLEADLVEEVVRLEGYDKVPAALPRVRHTETVLAPHYEPLKRLRHFLVSQGLTETIPWTFSSPTEVSRTKLGDSASSMVALANPLTANHSTMRSSLIPSLLNTVGHNVRNSQRNVAIFELGPVYQPAQNGSHPTEEPRLGVALTGLAEDQHWDRGQRPVDFYDMKGYAQDILELLGVVVAAFDPLEMPTLAKGHSASIKVDGNRIGTLGRVDPSVARAYDIEQPVYLLEIHLNTLLGRVESRPAFTEIPSYPPSLRDLAVVVDSAVPSAALRDIARSSGGKLLRRVDIFDVYTGEQVDLGKKSVALNLVFQSDERTLADSDTQKAWEKIVRALEHHYGARVR